MIDDATFDGGYDSPDGWERLPDVLQLSVVARYGFSEIAHLPLLAFADEFSSSLSVYGTRYIDLQRWTNYQINWPHSAETRAQKAAFDRLATAFPDTFTTVIGRYQPWQSWMALRVLQLTEPIIDALIELTDP